MDRAQFSPIRYEIIGRTADSATLITVTANASANTKGTYATIGTAGFRYDGFYLWIYPGQGAGVRYRIDVALNTGGSDVVIVEDYFVDASDRPGLVIWCPLRVPSGATVKARLQCTTGGNTASMAVQGYMSGPNGPPAYSRIIALTDFTNTDATNGLTMNGTTQTAWAQVMATTPMRVAGIYVCLSNRADNTRTTQSRYAFDIGRGAGGSEIIMFSQICANDANTNIESVSPSQQPYPVWYDLPASTRLSVRAVANAAAADSFGVCLFGLVP